MSSAKAIHFNQNHTYSSKTYSRTSLSAAHVAATKIIGAFLGKALHSVPTFSVSSNSVIVHLFYYSNATTVFTNLALSALGTTLSRLYPNLTVELRFVRLQRPYYNASILAHYLAINAAKYGFNRLENSLLNACGITPELTQMNSDLSVNNVNGMTNKINGVKIQLSGLLTTQRAAPRKTVFTASLGTFNKSKSIVTHGISTSKSRIGAFTVKTSLAMSNS